jgi:gas vesicle protein
MGLGAIVALLFAPRSGRETRDYLTQKAEESRGYVTTKGREIRGQAEAAVDRARDVVAKQKEQLSAALEAGKQAYQEEKGKAK